MTFQPKSFNADGTQDDDSIRAMRAALRSLKVVMHAPRGEHPRRAEMLDLLADAKVRIERINGAA